MHKYILLISGPITYLKEGPKIEKFIITQEEIDECREEGESDEEVIEYILEEACAEWEQRWCRAQAFTESQWRVVQPKFEW